MHWTTWECCVVSRALLIVCSSRYLSSMVNQFAESSFFRPIEVGEWLFGFRLGRMYEGVSSDGKSCDWIEGLLLWNIVREGQQLHSRPASRRHLPAQAVMITTTKTSNRRGNTILLARLSFWLIVEVKWARRHERIGWWNGWDIEKEGRNEAKDCTEEVESKNSTWR